MNVGTNRNNAMLPSARPAGAPLALRRAVLAAVVALLAAAPASAQKITEVVWDHVGSPDTHEYVELWASPGASLSSYRIVVLDGSANPGQILNVVTPGTANDAGFWSSGSLTPPLESPTFTVLLVSGFTGSEGQDLDGENDGSLDVEPWTLPVVDGVAFSDWPAGPGPTRLRSSDRESEAPRASRTTSTRTR